MCFLFCLSVFVSNFSIQRDKNKGKRGVDGTSERDGQNKRVKLKQDVSNERPRAGKKNAKLRNERPAAGERRNLTEGQEYLDYEGDTESYVDEPAGQCDDPTGKSVRKKTCSGTAYNTNDLEEIEDKDEEEEEDGERFYRRNHDEEQKRACSSYARGVQPRSSASHLPAKKKMKAATSTREGQGDRWRHRPSEAVEHDSDEDEEDVNSRKKMLNLVEVSACASQEMRKS